MVVLYEMNVLILISQRLDNYYQIKTKRRCSYSVATVLLAARTGGTKRGLSCILTCYQAGIRHINEDDAHINQCVLWKVPNYTGAALCPLNQLQSIINMPNGNMFFNFSGPLMSWNLNILQAINRGQQPGKK